MVCFPFSLVVVELHLRIDVLSVFQRCFKRLFGRFSDAEWIPVPYVFSLFMLLHYASFILMLFQFHV